MEVNNLAQVETLVKNGNVYTLHRDGNMAYCPFQPFIPTQTQLGAFDLIKMPCCSMCPHFNLHPNNLVEITCGKGNTFEIEEIVDDINKVKKLLHE